MRSFHSLMDKQEPLWKGYSFPLGGLVGAKLASTARLGFLNSAGF